MPLDDPPPVKPPELVPVRPASFKSSLRLATWPDGALILLLSLLLRLHGIGAKPYWLDEVTTLRRSSLALLPLVRDSLSFHHLPLFFLVAAAFEPFGLDPGTLRLPAALFGAVSCVLAYLVGRTVAGRIAGLVAALLLAVSPFQLQYAQEARSYTLVCCFILLGVWGVCRLAVAPRGDRAGWWLYAAGTALALDTLSVALFWFAAAQLCAMLIARTAGRRWWTRCWLPVQAAILVCYLPFIAAMVVLTHGRMGSGLDWVPPPTLHSVWSILQSVFLLRRSSLIAFRIFPGPLDPGGLPLLGLAVLALAGFGVWRFRRSHAVGMLVVATLALPVGVALCSLRSSLWMPRYLLWAGPMLFLLAGVGVASLPRRTALACTAALALFGLVNLAPYYRDETKPLWNRAAGLLRDEWKPGDLVLTDDPAAIAMMNVALDPAATVTGSVPKDGFGPQDWTADPRAAETAFAAGRRFWLVYGRVGQNDSADPARLLRSLKGLGEPFERRRIGLDIEVLRFDPPEGRAPATASAP